MILFPGTAVRAVLQVDVKDPLEQPFPADPVRPGRNRLGLASGGGGSLAGLPCHLGHIGAMPLWHHPCPQPGVRGQHAVEPDEMQPRPRHGCPKSTLRSPWRPAAA